MQTGDLIHNLARDLKPARRLWPPWARLAAWLFFSIAVAALVMSAFGLRPDLARKLFEARFGLEFLLLSLLTLLSSYATLELSIPDASRSPTTKRLAALPLLAWGLLLGGIFLVLGLFQGQSAHVLPGRGFGCIRDILAVGLIPGVLLFALARRARPVEPKLVGGLATLAIGALGALATQFLCKNDGGGHLLAWHFLPLIVLFAVGHLLGKRLLRW